MANRKLRLGIWGNLGGDFFVIGAARCDEFQSIEITSSLFLERGTIFVKLDELNGEKFFFYADNHEAISKGNNFSV